MRAAHLFRLEPRAEIAASCSPLPDPNAGLANSGSLTFSASTGGVGSAGTGVGIHTIF